jgi:hypothetical protein
VAPDVIGWTAQAGSRAGSGGGVATEGGQLSEAARSGRWRREDEPCHLLGSEPHGSEGVTAPSRQGETRKKMGPNRKSRLIHLEPAKRVNERIA